MRLYNTLSHTIEEFLPQSTNRTTIYTCGPTVYDYLHIGNWFTYIREDTLIRVLEAIDLRPEWVMNITDVGHLVSDADEGEDKLEKGARREGKTAWEVADFYTDYFLNGLKKLHIRRPDHLTKATDHIAEQISLIERLESKGYTYRTADGIYYDTSRFPDYAKLARLDLDELQAGARVAFNAEKRSSSDFALWKFSPTDHKRDMEWESPWGVGFPGWHIECSAMAMKYLGETLDIHAGGIDHIPVHHTNEIAQSEAVTGKPFARFWFHTNHIMISGDKISKSLGNGIVLEDIEQAGYNMEAFRLLVLESHYRTQSHFSWDTLEAASNRLQVYHQMAVLRWQDWKSGTQVVIDFEAHQAAILEALQNDLNTPQALAILSHVAEEVTSNGISAEDRDPFIKFLQFIDETLGLQLTKQTDISADQKQLIQERQSARGVQDWTLSDQLRDRLTAQHIGIKDTATGPTWYRL